MAAELVPVVAALLAPGEGGALDLVGTEERELA